MKEITENILKDKEDYYICHYQEGYDDGDDLELGEVGGYIYTEIYLNKCGSHMEEYIESKFCRVFGPIVHKPLPTLEELLEECSRGK